MVTLLVLVGAVCIKDVRLVLVVRSYRVRSTLLPQQGIVAGRPGGLVVTLKHY